jgi:hypothetical protein
MITAVSLNEIFAISFPNMPNNSLILSLWFLAKQHLVNSIGHSSSDKLIIPRLVKAFPAVYGNRKLITLFTIMRHVSLYRAI